MMGVGYPEDLVVSIALGADMFDCVWPTRTAVCIQIRTAISALLTTPSDSATLSLPQPASSTSAVEAGGLGVTKAFMSSIANRETAGAHLYVSTKFLWSILLKGRRLTMHNVHYLLALMASARAAIIADTYPQFLRSYFKRIYKHPSKYPTWAVTALRNVGVDLLLDPEEAA